MSFGTEIDVQIRKISGAVADMDEDAATVVIAEIKKLI